MKINQKPLLVLVVLSLSIIVPFASGLPRHEDPANLIGENADPGLLFQLYGFIYDHVALENFSDASYWLSWAEEVYAPNALETTVTRFNMLTAL